MLNVIKLTIKLMTFNRYGNNNVYNNYITAESVVTPAKTLKVLPMLKVNNNIKTLLKFRNIFTRVMIKLITRTFTIITVLIKLRITMI